MYSLQTNIPLYSNARLEKTLLKVERMVMGLYSGVIVQQIITYEYTELFVTKNA